ncbi:MAG: EVE domain-containing protein [Bacteriovoracaceae bacterium]|nr:EVE domain-containing protein [Bacteriovoracaceae bacterium]
MWLIKSEPDVFSFENLMKSPKSTTCWHGVRNYQARNYMRDEMKLGDLVLYYHSNCDVPGVVGIAKVVKESYPDATAFEKKSDYFDPKATKENPRWFMVDVQAVAPMKQHVSLEDIKKNSKLSQMKLVQKGSRLSVQPVTESEFQEICKMGKVNF